VLERFQDQVALDLGDGAANQVPGNLFGCHGRMSGKISASRLVKPCTVPRKNPVNANFDAGREHAHLTRQDLPSLRLASG
jgi:hypothetical protein